MKSIFIIIFIVKNNSLYFLDLDTILFNVFFWLFNLFTVKTVTFSALIKKLTYVCSLLHLESQNAGGGSRRELRPTI